MSGKPLGTNCLPRKKQLLETETRWPRSVAGCQWLKSTRTTSLKVWTERQACSTCSSRGETFGLSVFFRDGKTVYRSYFTNGRGVEALDATRAPGDRGGLTQRMATDRTISMVAATR